MTKAIEALKQAEEIRTIIECMELELEWVEAVPETVIWQCVGYMSSFVKDYDKREMEKRPWLKDVRRKQIAKEWGLEIPKPAKRKYTRRAKVKS